MANNPLSNSIPFYINGGKPSSATDLRIGNVSRTDGGIRFGLFNNGSLPLFIEGASFIPTNDSIDLTIRGSSPGYKYDFKTINLFISGMPFNQRLNLFIKGTDVFRVNNANLNLFVHGEGFRVTQPLDLVIWGSNANYSLSLNHLTMEQLVQLTINELYTLAIDSSQIFSGYHVAKALDLYIRGEGLFENFLTYSTWMNLYLQGGVGSTKELNLFIQGSPYLGQSLDLYSYGVTGLASGSIPLYTFSKDTFIQKLNLFIRGYR